ncbi:tyrosine-type recombinase/integrase [Nocardia brasiliensis]|uniref:tyrosine-type recombinase/integrase n=1 Tax=Nocardia brasiliensis TaxID=37326 RepID=UPI003D7A65B4
MNGGHLGQTTFRRHWVKACRAVGRWRYEDADDEAGQPDLTLHDLRHTGATLAAATGATLAALMERLGHSTHQAAMRYQHAASGSDEAIALGLSVLAGVTPSPTAPQSAMQRRRPKAVSAGQHGARKRRPAIRVSKIARGRERDLRGSAD